MSTIGWSVKDLENKWKRKLPEERAGSLPWQLLQILVDGLSQDTKLPLDRLRAAIQQRDVGEYFAIGDNLDFTEYESPDLLLQDRLVVSLFSKFPFKNSPFNKREKAMLRFAEAEVLCSDANFRVGRGLGLSHPVNAVIHRAIRVVEEVLGRFSVDEMLTSSRFGPGASLCVKGSFTTEYFKLCEKNPTVTSGAFPYAEALLAYDKKWKGYLTGVQPLDVVGDFDPLPGSEPELKISDYNKVTFVPKNAKTERSIAIEPYFNVYFQLGVGGMIRRRLRRRGIDLDTQERNQTLARKGSIDNSLATIDFSMASDTVSLETVRLLMPPVWFEHLDRLRSKKYQLNGRYNLYSKFSSMGNGFTFELETLIFYSVAVACCQELGVGTEDITVFGDDVILPSNVVDLFREVCVYLGFVVNEEKSFCEGPFRESCGEDYLKGHSVRPLFCKQLDTIQEAAKLSNQLLTLRRFVGDASRTFESLGHCVDSLRSHIPRDVREIVVGPPSENVDSYLHVEDFATLTRSPLVWWVPHLYCWRHPSVSFQPTKIPSRESGALQLWLNQSLAHEASSLKPLNAHRNGLFRAHSIKHIEALAELTERTPLKITGRKIGRLRLGHSLVWSLGFR